MTISILQARQNSLGSGSVGSIARAFSSNVSAGSYLYFAASSSGNQTVSAADTLNGAYTILDQLNLSTGSQLTHGWVFNPSGGANTVTVSFPSNSTFPGIFIAEIAGSSGLDPGGTAHSANYQPTITTGVGAITSGSVTPSVANGLCIGVTFSGNLNSNFSADTSAGFVDIVGAGAILGSAVFWQFTTGGNLGDAEYQIYSSISSVPALFTAASSASTAGTVAALFAQSGGGASIPAPMYHRKNILYFI